jgi:hypothetical protein
MWKESDHMTERNEHDERADRSVFEPAIAWLREELANIERQASATRALIEALVVRAKIADPARAKTATAKASSPGRHRSSRTAPDRQKRVPVQTTRHMLTNRAAAAGKDSVRELAGIVSTVAAATERLAMAARSKDVAGIKAAVSAIATAERRGGEILIKLGGSLKPLPVSQADRKRWRQAAARSPTAFDAKLKRDIATALARISSNATSAATMDKARPPSRPPAPARPVKRPRPVSASQPPINKLSGWHQEADGSLTRTVTSVEDDVAAVPAGV